MLVDLMIPIYGTDLRMRLTRPSFFFSAFARAKSRWLPRAMVPELDLK